MNKLCWNYSLHALLISFLLGIISIGSHAQNIGPGIEKNLVSFFPEIFSYSETLCLGFRVSESQVATSPGCILEIHKTLNKEEYIEVHDAEGAAIGSISLNHHTLPGKVTDPGNLIVIQANSRYEYQIESAFYNSQSLPIDALAFYLNEQSTVSKNEVLLTFSDSLYNTNHFGLESGQTLPEGAPVYNKNGQFICIVTSENECTALPSWLTHTHTEYEPYPLSIDHSITGILIIAVVVVAITAGGISIVKAIIPGLLYIAYLASAFFLSTPQAQCALTGGCSDGCCCGR